MADPHSLQLPSAADLVRAFVADLANVLDVDFSGGKPTVSKTLWSTGATTIVAERDYTIVGVKALAGGTYVLAEVSITPAQVGLANGTIYNVIAACTSAAAGAYDMTIPLRWFWKLGQKLYLNTGGGTGLLLILEP